MRKLYLQLFLFLVFISVTAFAQENGLLRTVVLSSEDGTPIPGANVLIFHSENDDNSNPNFFGVTNREGFTEIRNIPPNQNYLLRVSFIGFSTYEEQFTLSSGERKILRIKLELSVSAFEELLVEGKRTVTVGRAGIETISRLDIERIPTPGIEGDLVTFLQTEPGVITSGDRGGDLYIRGGTPYQNLILVDNIPVVKPFHISNLFSAIPSSLVQNVDLYAGGFSANYAGASSAVLDIGLRPGNMRKYNSSVSFSPYLSSFLFEGPTKYDEQSVLISARISTIQAFSPFLTGEENNIHFGDFITRYTIQGSGFSCNITGMYTMDEGEITPYREIDHSWSNVVLGSSCLGIDPQLNYPVRATAGFSYFTSEENAPEFTEQNTSLSQLFFDIERQQSVFNNIFDYGFGVNFKDYRTVLNERFSSFESISRNIVIIDLFVSTDIEIGKRTVFQVGAASQLSLDTNPTFEPRSRVSIQLGENRNHELSFAIGKYVQIFTELTDERDVGTLFTTLLPLELGDPLPTAIHGIATYSLNIGRDFTGKIESFYKSLDNIQVSKWNPEVGLETETALAEGVSYGLDVQLEWSKRQFFTSVGYGLAYVEYEALSGDLGAWILEPVFSYNPPHDQRHKINTVLSYKIENFTFASRWEYGTGKPFTKVFGYDFFFDLPFENPETLPGTARTLYSEPFGERLPDYHRLDLSIQHELRIDDRFVLTSQIGAINLYNRANLYNYDHNSQERIDQIPFLPYAAVKVGFN